MRLISMMLVPILVATAPAPYGLAFGKSVPTRELSVSLPSFRIAGNERVVSFQCDIRSATVVQLSRVPDGWTLEVTNDNGDMASLRGSRIVGAAAFTDSSYFKNFMIIDMNYPSTSSNGPPFQMDFRITLEEDTESDTRRELTFSTSDVILTPLH